MSVIGVVGLVVLGIAVLLLGIGLAARAAQAAIAGPLAERVAANVPETEIVRRDLRANFFGLQSKGPAQLRGNGALVLTRNALRFFQLVPASEIVVPLADVREATLVRSHLGKSVGYSLLKVTFSSGGTTDSIAWFVPEAEAWRAAVDAARRSAP